MRRYGLKKERKEGGGKGEGRKARRYLRLIRAPDQHNWKDAAPPGWTPIERTEGRYFVDERVGLHVVAAAGPSASGSAGGEEAIDQRGPKRPR